MLEFLSYEMSENATKIAVFVICIILIILIIVLIRMSYQYQAENIQVEAKERDNTFTEQDIENHYNKSISSIDTTEEYDDNIDEDYEIEYEVDYEVDSEEYMRLYNKVKVMDKINEIHKADIESRVKDKENVDNNKNEDSTFVSKGEKECKRSVEKLLGKKFTKVRPDFLKYKTGRNLELDMYNDELKIAVEYNGKQHYEYTTIFHKSEEDFYNALERDEFKKDKCDEEGITLIIVPYTVKNDDIYEHIRQKLIKSGKLKVI